jgi:molybdopterin synthase catalytic subunit
MVRVQREPFDPWQELAAAEARLAAAGAHGATAVFVGSLRDYNRGRPVSAMTLEHYPGMTEAHLEKVAGEAAARWPILDALVVHRYGALTPGEPIVLVAVWSAHRDPAFAACRYIIDELKTRAPFWKREQTAAGARWVTPEE